MHHFFKIDVSCGIASYVPARFGRSEKCFTFERCGYNTAQPANTTTPAANGGCVPTMVGRRSPHGLPQGVKPEKVRAGTRWRVCRDRASPTTALVAHSYSMAMDQVTWFQCWTACVREPKPSGQGSFGYHWPEGPRGVHPLGLFFGTKCNQFDRYNPYEQNNASVYPYFRSCEIPHKSSSMRCAITRY